MRLLLALLLFAPAGTIEWSTKLRFRDWGQIASDGKVVVGGNSTGDGGVYAVDAASGKLLWRAATDQSGAVAIGEGLAFVEATLRSQPQQAILAYDLRSGKEIWRQLTGARRTDFIAYNDGRVYSVDQDQATLTARDARRGQPLWTFNYGPGCGHCETRMAFQSGTVYWGAGENDQAIDIRQKPAGNFLFALEAATGKLLWRSAFKVNPYDSLGSCVAAPVVAGGLVFSSVYGSAFAVDAATGATRWRREVTLAGNSSKRLELTAPQAVNGVVVYGSSQGLHAFRQADGSPLWTSTWPDPSPNVSIGFLFADGILYASPQGKPGNGVLYAYDAAQGQVLWKLDLPGWFSRHMIAIPGAILAETSNAVLRIAR